uniref:Chalcone isomerase domain-containing protein n=1 Tax=Araucaria cunninghamii TaxID=56994 RepID=A0A0D6QW10_ARACU
MGSVPLHPSLNSPPFPPNSSPRSSSSANLSRHLAVGVGVGVGLGLSFAPQFASQRRWVAKNLWEFCSQKPRAANPYLWGPLASLSLTAEVAHTDSQNTVVESTTGVPFPSALEDTKQLAGVGVRRKSIMGLKNINVYAFGVYADESSLKEKLLDKYGKRPATELKESKEFYEDVLENDVGLSVRLEIVYGKLSIGSVRSAFEESIGSRLQKFSGTQNKELLQRFTSQFKDDYKLPRGTKIDLVRLPGHILQTKIDGKEIGSIQSQLLCRSLFDLYIGEEPLDKQAKEKIVLGLASLMTQ